MLSLPNPPHPRVLPGLKVASNRDAIVGAFLALSALMLGLPGCRSGTEDAEAFYPDVPLPIEPVEPQHPAHLELVREYGDRDEGLVFGRISVMAASPSGELAVYDDHGCKVWLIDTQTGDWTTLGGCGEGPGELQLVTAIAFDADTLVVFDESAMASVKISREGEELSRFQFPWRELDAWGIKSITIPPDGSLLVALRLISANYQDRPDNHLQFARFDGTTGSILEKALTTPPITLKTLNTLPRFALHCAPSSELIFVANVWGPQVMILKQSDFSPVASVRVPLKWPLLVQDSRYEEDHFFPRPPTPGVACGDGFSVVGYRLFDWDADDNTFIAAGMAFVFDNEGKLIASLQEQTPPAPDSPLRLTPGAAAGDRVFFFTNDFSDYPIVREYKLVRSEGGS